VRPENKTLCLASTCCGDFDVSDVGWFGSCRFGDFVKSPVRLHAREIIVDYESLRVGGLKISSMLRTIIESTVRSKKILVRCI
jgi:hypothetical protein